MSDFDRNMKEALDGGGGFDPDRTRAVHEEVYQSYRQKLKWSERGMWVALCLLNAVGLYALWGFILQATTTKEWIGYGMAIMWAVVFTIQINVLCAITNNRLMTLKEIKQLRLALVSGAAPPDDAAAKPLHGVSRWERSAWICAVLAVSVSACLVGALTNRQDDLWRLKAQNRIEAHSILTLRRFPHDIPGFYSIKGPVEGAVLKTATLNGRPVSFECFTTLTQYRILLPYSVSWTKDKIELVWDFSLLALQQPGIWLGSFRAPLRSLMPVHYYSLTLHVEDDSGYVGKGDAWRFMKTPDELKNETEARQTLKLFTQQIRGGGPRDNFGTCGLPIIPRPIR